MTAVGFSKKADSIQYPAKLSMKASITDFKLYQEGRQ